jgi:hypothetical protein
LPVRHRWPAKRFRQRPAKFDEGTPDVPDGPGALAVAHPLPYSRKLAAQIIRNEANSAAMISIRAELGT